MTVYHEIFEVTNTIIWYMRSFISFISSSLSPFLAAIIVYSVTPDKGNICHTSCNGVPNNCYYRELDMDTMKLINLNKKGEPTLHP